MSEAPPLLNDEAARSPSGEILDQSQTQALEARRTELEAQRTSTEAKPAVDPTPASSESKPTTPSEADTKPTDPAKPVDPAAPKVEPYTAFAAPEGYTIDKALVDQVTPLFREAGLTQDQAQKLVDLHVKNAIDSAKAPAATYAKTREGWQAEVRADKEIAAYSRDGKTGLDAVQVDVARALNALGDTKLAQDFRSAMDLTGAGDNPAFVRTFWKLAQHIVEGKAVGGKGPSPLGQVDPSKPIKPSPAQSMYPNLPSASA